uniref:CPBP family intramembrane glutamic endopeptidase n=1 Tax=Staphylococcus aureus TaxID=1280 RepID=UPI00210A17A2
DNDVNFLVYIFYIFTVTIIPAIVEEIVFRGMIIRVIFRKHLFLELLVSSLVFASLHESDTWIGYLPYLYTGLIFGLIYIKTKRLEMVIFLHFLNNLLALLFIIWG